MAPINDAYTEHQLKRWMRPDAHHFVRPDWRRHDGPGSDLASIFELYERKYSPEQPRDDHGRWTSDGTAGNGSTNDGEADVNKILAEAKRIAAAGGASYNYCLAKCSTLLERIQPLSSDRNTWDFHKCMNACLGR